MLPAWPASRGIADRLVPLVVGLLLLGFTLQQVNQSSRYPDAPIGCDPFGYQRQAALFRAHGLGGLDTRLETPNARRLIDLMRASGEPADSWSQAVAPHCHHYKATVDRVVLQYPPGTGFLMAAFPARLQGRGLLIAATLAIAAAFAALAGGSASIAAGAGALVAGGLVVAAERSAHYSDSVAPALLLAVLSGALLDRAFAARRPWLPLLVGLLIGLSGVVRVANLALAFGPLAVLGWRLLAQRRGVDLLRLAAFALGALAGTAPLLAANLINAGSILATTYSPADASAPVADLAALWRGLQFYLQPSATALLLVVALLAGGWMLVRGRRPALLSALLSMALSLAYLVPKAILISYYLTSPAGFLLAAAVAPAALRHADWPRAARAAAVVLVGGAIWAGVRHYHPADATVAPAVRAALAEDPIVWTDEIGGRFVLEHGAYAAKLQFTWPAVQDRLLAEAAAAGIPQLIAIDTDMMRGVAARLGGTWRLTPLGEAYGAEVDRLEPKGR